MGIGAIVTSLLVTLSLLYSKVLAEDRVTPNIHYVSGLRFDISPEFWKLSTDETPVKIECSLDQGQTWQPVMQPANASISRTQKFSFVGQVDGEYFFRLHTLHGDRPAIHTPIIIVLDSMRPTAELTMEMDGSERSTAHFVVADINLNPDSVRIYYQLSTTEPWQQCSATATQSPNSNAWRGSCELPNVGENKRMQVRLVGKDYADNSIEIVRFPELDVFPNSKPSLASCDDPTVSSSAPSSGQQSDVDQSEATPVSMAAFPMNSVPDEPAVSMASEIDELASLEPVSPSNRVYSNTREFKLDFALEQDAAQATCIELWATTDSGRSWSLWGVSNSPSDPIQVEVAEDGEFGFYLSPLVNEQPNTTGPSSGQEPTIRVVVDTKSPTPKIIKVEPSDGNSNALAIEYGCLTEDVATLATTISWSTTSHGPWEVVKDRLPENGSHVWEPRTQIADTIYLKIESRDRAGNIGGHVSKAEIGSLKKNQQLSSKSGTASTHP
jgi:hypothetical protein